MGGLESIVSLMGFYPEKSRENAVLPLKFDIQPGKPLQILCLGAHSDDIEIGCGGTLLKLSKTMPEVVVHWVVFNAIGKREAEALASAEAFLTAVANKTIKTYSFKDAFFPYIGAEIKNAFEQLKKECEPHLIFTHFRQDRHQDHRLISDLTWNTFRNHLIFEYEIPKYDGDLGSPNFFVTLSKSISQTKVDLIMQYFKSQQGRHWFAEETFYSMLRLRGMECRAADLYAEAFYCRKIMV